MKNIILIIIRYVFGLSILVLSLLFAVFLAAIFIKIWPFKILTSPTPQVLVIGLSALVLSGAIWAFLAKRADILENSRWLPTIGYNGILLAIICLLYTLTIQSPAQVSANTPKNQITFTTYNRLYTDDNIITPTDYIKSQNSDIISLQEVYSPTYTKEFAALVNLPHYVKSPDNDTGLISRWPIKDTQILQNGTKKVIRAVIETPYGDVVTYAVHVTPPFSNTMYKEGLQELEKLSSWVSDEKQPVVVGGDFNTAIYSPEMRAYTKKISSTTKHTTEQAWPKCNWYGYGTLTCLRLDHVFIPNTSEFYGSEISPDLGSDHRAVTVRFSL